MPTPLIPQRPKKGSYDLKQEEMQALTYHVLSGCSRDEAFVKFVRPDFIGSKATPALKAAISQFFGLKDVKEYIAAYKDTIEELLKKASQAETSSTKSIEERKAAAKTKLVEFAMSLADNIDQSADPEFVLKMADKAGLLDGDDKVEAVPSRYIPTQCWECAYRMFCEENTEDMCQYCRYHQFGEENGVHYDKEKMLEVPVGTEFAEEQQPNE